MYHNLAHSYGIDPVAVSPSRYSTYLLTFTGYTITGDTESQSYSLSDTLTLYYPRKT